MVENPKDYRWHLGHLDSLRGIAVLGVILVHSVIGVPVGRHVEMIANTGQRGVQLFFVVSAFTLFMSYDHRREEHHPHRNFFLRRFFRLAPMYYLAHIVTRLVKPEWGANAGQTLLSLLFLNGFSPTTINHGTAGGWSVATEAIFYMCLPLLFRTIRSLAAAICLLFISAPPLFYLSIYLSRRFPGNDYFGFFGFSVEMPVFAMGILAYFVWKKYIAAPHQTAPKHRELSVVLLGLAAVMYYQNLPFSNARLYPTSLVAMLLLLALSVHPWALLVNRITIFLGRISFSIYLLHFFVMLWIRVLVARAAAASPLLHPHPVAWFILVFVGTLALTVPISALTWRFVEVPGIHLGRRLIAHLEGRALRRKEAQLVPPFQSLAGTSNSPDAQF